jgi:hypothetical protein
MMSSPASWIAGPAWEKIKADTIIQLTCVPVPDPNLPAPEWPWWSEFAWGLMPLLTLSASIPLLVGLAEAR